MDTKLENKFVSTLIHVGLSLSLPNYPRLVIISCLLLVNLFIICYQQNYRVFITILITVFLLNERRMNCSGISQFTCNKAICLRIVGYRIQIADNSEMHLKYSNRNWRTNNHCRCCIFILLLLNFSKNFWIKKIK